MFSCLGYIFSVPIFVLFAVFRYLGQRRHLVRAEGSADLKEFVILIFSLSKSFVNV